MPSAYPILRPRSSTDPHNPEALSKLAARPLPQLGKEWIQAELRQIDEASQRA
ncbi:MAG TPA: hypothetical protein VFV38_16030 [Ktedonobacteraceae bacterium]|nr:hypothetical protein [Ktedonobacteraceae bacterium]